jgi:hypothetical protein
MVTVLYDMGYQVRLALSKGPNSIDVFPPPSYEEGNISSSRNVEFSSYSEFWKKEKV